MKVVMTDNYSRDHIPDVLVAEGLSEEDAFDLVEKLNGISRPEDKYFVFVPDDYVLNSGNPFQDGTCV